MAAKTIILYTSASTIAAAAARVADVRAAGQPVRLVEIEQFRGETEQNAGIVLVDAPIDPTVREAIEMAYPHLVVQDAPEEFQVIPISQQVPQEAVDATMRDLRLRLIRAGGTAPAGASAEELANLIAAQEANQDIGARTPVLPTPASAGTVIPDSTPVVARIGADALVAESAVGTTPEALAAAVDTAGEGSGQSHPGAHSPVAEGGDTGKAVSSTATDVPSDAQKADLSLIRTHNEADAVAKGEGVDLAGRTTVADKVKAITEARG